MPGRRLPRLTAGIAWLALSALLVPAPFGQASRAEERTISRTGISVEEGRSLAVRVRNAALVHTAQLLPGESKGAEAQVRDVLRQLELLLNEFQSTRDDVAKLNVYVRDAPTRSLFSAQLAEWSGPSLPAVAYVATPLPDPRAHVGLDAVFAARTTDDPREPTLHHFEQLEQLGGDPARTHAGLLPRGDVVYLSGQAERGNLAEATRGTLESLLRTLEHMRLSRPHIVSIKTFVQPMTEVEVVNEQIARFFGEAAVPPVSHVEWLSGSRPIEIELIAWAPPAETRERVTYTTPPGMTASPLFSRVATIHGGERIYVSGLYAPEPAGAEVRAVFHELAGILKEAGSDFGHLAKATYYVSTNEVSGKLNAVRPEFYDPQRPPAASKAMVADVAAEERTLTIDMIAAPTAGESP